MTPPDVDTPLLEQARRLAENGDLDGAAGILSGLARDPDGPDRAQAAVGLAVVLEQRGDADAARAAARVALESGHPEYAAQAACHLAQGFEREGRLDQARGAWQAVIGVGNAAYAPLAHLALARLAAHDGDLDRAESELRSAIAVGEPELGAHAAQQLAELLLERGEPGEAADVLLAALAEAPASATPRLRVQLGIAHLELACAEFAGAVEDGAEPETSALAIELLARTLPLRGRTDDAEQVWSYGLGHADPVLAAEVTLRFNRDT
ncbi:tetratricopeptide repeat protein [Nonomuraea longicatena]|uniref:Ancillary SecYEG translocon subunit/Cell division coordinator CpoB TPR domain-containing protein n=1 Tax=Nonomuraea longicatena TaxID=83682 RepID=A0ABP4ANG8_9ACTN